MQKGINWQLFVTFLKIGGFTLGGGAAMVPMMQREIVDRNHWLTNEEFLDIYAVSQDTPGIFAVDMASHIGYKYGGLRAGISAALGVVTPSLVIILAIAIVFVYTFTMSWLGYKLIDSLIPMRVSTYSEKVGLDLSQHDEHYGLAHIGERELAEYAEHIREKENK